eukprot:287116_1
MALSDFTLWSIAIINAASLSLISVPLLSYYLYKFYCRRAEMFIFKRYPQLVYIGNICTIIAVVMWSCSNSMKKLSPMEDTNHLAFTILGRTQNIVATPLVYSIQGTMLCRLWLMFYDLHYSNSNMNKQWRTHLNPTLSKNNFWMKHKSTLGSQSYSFKVSCAIVFIISIIPIVYGQLTFPSPNINLFITIPLHFIFVSIFVVLACRSPHILDLFYMRYELKLLVIIMVSGNVFMIVVTPLASLQNHILAIIGLIIRIDAGILAYILLALSSTWFISRKLDNKYNKEYESRPQKEQCMKLQRVLLDPYNFQLFVQHLTREFSIETILCFVEMVQFKYVLNSTFRLNALVPNHTTSDDHKCNDDMQIEIYFDFKKCDITKNSAIPKSFIVYKSDESSTDLTPFLKMAYKLYIKYIKIGVELEINVSGHTRDIFINDMEGGMQPFINNMANNENPIAMDAKKLFEYFDIIIEEMYLLLGSSCDRFLETDTNINIARIHLPNADSIEIENTLKQSIFCQ